MSFHSVSRRVVLSGIGASVLFAPHVARAAIRTARIGANSSASSQFGQGARAFADAVAAHPDLRNVLKIDLRVDAEFGTDLPRIKDCMSNILEFNATANSPMASVVPEAGLLDAPFVFKSVAQGRAAIDGALGREYAEIMKAAGINILAWAENGLRHITSNRPIRTPADLRGLKLRVPESKIVVDTFNALGAEAKPLPFSQVYEALRTGQLDAQENPISNIEDAKLNEVQKYLSITGHIYSTGMFIASDDLLADLTPSQIDAVKDCARLGGQVTRKVAEESQKAGVARLVNGGMTLVDGVDVPAFVAASKPALEALGATFGHDRIARLLNA